MGDGFLLVRFPHSRNWDIQFYSNDDRFCSECHFVCCFIRFDFAKRYTHLCCVFVVHQKRSNKLTNLFWLFSDNVVGCHMSSTTFPNENSILLWPVYRMWPENFSICAHFPSFFLSLAVSSLFYECRNVLYFILILLATIRFLCTPRKFTILSLSISLSLSLSFVSVLFLIVLRCAWDTYIRISEELATLMDILPGAMCFCRTCNAFNML